jgi:uncharacterized protein
MTWPDALLLLAAGIGAGLAGSIAGLASLFSYPALLAIGLAPLTANVTNSIALVFSSVGSVASARSELRHENRRRLGGLIAVSIAGGLTGGLLLILLPAAAFEAVVPVLIAFASLAVLLPRRRTAETHADEHPRWLIVAVFGIGLYGGYFGAAAGTLLLAVLLIATVNTFAGCNAVKNIVLGAANGTAAILFALTTHVDWAAVPPLAAGSLIGGWIGPIVVRHAPVQPLRWLIALAGVGLAVKLGIQEYG